MPRWVKVSGIVLLLLAVLLVVMLLSGHGPSRHMTGAPANPGKAFATVYLVPGSEA